MKSIRSKGYCKWFICMVVIVAALGVFAIPVQAQADTVVTLDGEVLEFDVPPVIVDGRVLIPMRVIFEALGANLSWDGSTGTVTATAGGRVIIMQVGNVEMTIDDAVILLDVPPQLINGRTLVPARAVAESLDADVRWDRQTSTAIITSYTPEYETMPYTDDVIDCSSNEETNNDTAGSATSLAGLPARNPTRTALHGHDGYLSSEIHSNIRRYFEQYLLPTVVYAYTDRIWGYIAADYIEDLFFLLAHYWNSLLADIMAYELNYAQILTPDMDPRAAAELAVDIADEYGLLLPDNIYDIVIVKLADGTTVAVLIMSETGWNLISTYMALVYFEDAGFVVFAVEKSFGEGRYMLCAIGINQRANFGPVENDIDAFLDALEELLYELDIILN